MRKWIASNLHPNSASLAGDAVFSAIGDPEAVISRAEELQDSGQTQLALHVIDLIANAGTVNDVVLRARQLKASLCRQRAKEVRPYVSKALFESSARLLENGKVSWRSKNE